MLVKIVVLKFLLYFTFFFFVIRDRNSRKTDFCILKYKNHKAHSCYFSTSKLIIVDLGTCRSVLKLPYLMT